MREVIRKYRQSTIAGVFILLAVPVGFAAGSENPIGTYLAVLFGGAIVAAVIVAPFAHRAYKNMQG